MMNFILKLAKIVAICFRLTSVTIACLIPKEKKLWVFGGWYGQRISDNPKYLLQYINNHQSHNTRAVWIYKNNNVKIEALRLKIEAYHYKSFKGILIQLRASMVFYTHTIHTDLNSNYISWNTKRIQMWHGIPLKKIGYDDEFSFSRFRKNKLYRLTINNVNTYVLSTGGNVSKIFQSAFDEPPEKMLNSGFPRNDVFFIKSKKKIEDEYNVLYMPTLRSGYDTTFNLLDERYNFNLAAVDEFLREKDVKLTLRIHPANKPDEQMVKAIEISDNIYMSSSDDIYNEIGEYDCLITDYSSVMFDFALSGKQIIFAAFDLTEYLLDDRGMYFDYRSIAGESIAYSWLEVLSLLNNGLNNKGTYNYPYLLGFHDDVNDKGEEHYYSRKLYYSLMREINRSCPIE